MANIVRSDPLEDLFRGFFVRPVEFGSPLEAPTHIRVDVRENADAYLVHADVPGVKKEDIQVQIDGDTLTISAERKTEKEVKEGERVLRTERSYGKISRSFQLGYELDEARSTAKYVDGVLQLELPKKSVPQAKRLTVQ